MAKFDREEFFRETKGRPARLIAAIAVRSAMRLLPTIAIRPTRKEEQGFSYWRQDRRASHALAIFRGYQNALTAAASREYPAAAYTAADDAKAAAAEAEAAAKTAA